MATGLKKLAPEERLGTFGVGHGSRFDCRFKRCTECDERKIVKGAHYVGGRKRDRVMGRFVCAECWEKLGLGNKTPNVQSDRLAEDKGGTGK